MTNLEQAKRLKNAGLPQDAKIAGDGGIFQSCGKLYYSPSEKQLMDWLAKNTESGIILCSETTEDDLPYWELTAYAKYEDIEVKHADLTEALVMAVEAVLKGAK